MNFARENERQHWSVVIGDSRYRRKHLVVTCPLETQRSRNKEKTEKWGGGEGGYAARIVPGTRKRRQRFLERGKKGGLLACHVLAGTRRNFPLRERTAGWWNGGMEIRGILHTTAIVRTSRFAERPSNGQRVFFEPKMRPSPPPPLLTVAKVTVSFSFPFSFFPNDTYSPLREKYLFCAFRSWISMLIPRLLIRRRGGSVIDLTLISLKR